LAIPGSKPRRSLNLRGLLLPEAVVVEAVVVGWFTKELLPGMLLTFFKELV
jgi:hypothetical protein